MGFFFGIFLRDANFSLVGYVESQRFDSFSEIGHGDIPFERKVADGAWATV